MVSLKFSIDIILPAALWPLWLDTASNRNEYQEYILGGRGGRCVGLTTLPPSFSDYLEIWGTSTCWNPVGLSRAVMGIALLLSLIFTYTVNFHLLVIEDRTHGAWYCINILAVVISAVWYGVSCLWC
jgi:hypothetical protein